MGRSRSRSRSHGRRQTRSYSRSRSRSSEDDGYRVHVSDLGIDPSKREISKAFDKFGPIYEVWLARNPPCFAFVKYKYREDAERAIREMDGKVMSGGRVRVSFARPRTKGRRRRGFDPNLRCYQCGEKGHFSRDCAEVWRQRRQDKSRSASRSRSRSGSRNRSRRRRSSHKRNHQSRSPSRSRSSSHSKSRKKSSNKKASKSRQQSKLPASPHLDQGKDNNGKGNHIQNDDNKQGEQDENVEESISQHISDQETAEVDSQERKMSSDVDVDDDHKQETGSPQIHLPGQLSALCTDDKNTETQESQDMERDEEKEEKREDEDERKETEDDEED